MATANVVLFKKIEEQIITARIGLLIAQPFWGNLATRLNIVDVTEDGWLESAATDGKNLFINCDFMSKLDIKETQFLVGHEIGHCVYDHFGRKGDRNGELWNIAGDYVINDELINAKVGSPPKAFPPLYDRKYHGKCTEEVYDELYKNVKKIDLSKLKTLDQHLPMEGDNKSQGTSDTEDSDNTGKKPMPVMSKEKVKELQTEFRQAVIAAAQAAGAGNVPASIKRLIKEFTEPQISWRELIGQQVQSIIKSDFTWARPNRKTLSAGIYLPGMTPDETIDVVVFIDTSGSISGKMLKDFLGEVQGIMEQYREFTITIGTFDTQVYNVQKFDENNRYDLPNYEAIGGGGTDFMAMFKWMQENDVRPKKLIVFTDGYPFGAWGEPDFADVVWIIHGSESIIPPFGVHAYYPKEEKARN
jgi:predicted metal-dependent peptidase